MALLKIALLALLCMYASCQRLKNDANENDSKSVQQIKEAKDESVQQMTKTKDESVQQKMNEKKDAPKNSKDAPEQQKDLLGFLGKVAGAVVSGAASIVGGVANGVAGAAHGLIGGAAHIVNTAVCAVKGVGAALAGKEHSCENHGHGGNVGGYTGGYMVYKDDCWGACGSKTGMCSACGEMGYCCKRGVYGCPEGMKQAANERMHTCVRYKNAPEYEEGMRGQTGCPKGYKPVTSVEECKGAAATYLARPFINAACNGFDANTCFSDARNTYYSTCQSAPRPHHRPVCKRAQTQTQCMWAANTAPDGKTLNIGVKGSRQCASDCFQHSHTPQGRGINGAVIRHSDGVCFCVVGMTRQVAHQQFSSCFFQVVAKDPAAKPELQVEDFDVKEFEFAKKK